MPRPPSPPPRSSRAVAARGRHPIPDERQGVGSEEGAPTPSYCAQTFYCHPPPPSLSLEPPRCAASPKTVLEFRVQRTSGALGGPVRWRLLGGGGGPLSPFQGPGGGLSGVLFSLPVPLPLHTRPRTPRGPTAVAGDWAGGRGGAGVEWGLHLRGCRGTRPSSVLFGQSGPPAY